MKQLKCSECGTVNRVEAHSFRTSPLCGRCRTRLPEPLLNPLLRGAAFGKYWWLLGMTVVLAVLGYCNIHPGLETLAALVGAPKAPVAEAAAPPQPAREEEPGPEPAARPSRSATVEQPAAMIPYAPGYQGPAPGVLPLPPTGAGRAYVRARADHWIDVRIKDGPDANSLVRVYRAADNAVVAERFIRSGGRLKIQLPAGIFIVRCASGRDWYGPDLYFGEGTEFSEAQAQFDLRAEGAYYDLRLILETDGNLESKEIARDRF